jgi:uncharacterized membrane protein
VDAVCGGARALGLVLLAGFALSPFLPLLTRYLPASAPLERAARVWFELHCERDPARTLNLAGVALGVCARCSGIYIGLGLGALLRVPALSAPATRAWVGVGAALMLLDVLLEDQGLHGGWPAVRLLTGVLLAYPVGVGLGALLMRAPHATHKP